MRRARLWLAVGWLFWVCLPARSTGQATDANLRLYVGNSRGDDVSIVDMGSMKVVGDVKLADRIHGICVQADGSRLFTTVESDNTLRIVDTTTQRPVASVKLSGRPNQCAVTPDGKYVAVPIRDGDKVDIVDVSKLVVVKSLPIKEPHNALNTGSNRYIYVSSMGSHEVNVIDLEKMDYSAVVPAGGRPRPYAVSQDGKVMFVAVTDLHGFVIVDIPPTKRYWIEWRCLPSVLRIPCSTSPTIPARTVWRFLRMEANSG